MTPNQTRRLPGMKVGVTCWNNAMSGVDNNAAISDPARPAPVTVCRISEPDFHMKDTAPDGR